MKMLPLAAWPLLLAGLAFGQDKAETREVRIYLLDRSSPERNLKDSVAVLTLEQSTGRSRTFLCPRVAKGTPTPGEERAAGLIRGLIGSSYFVEFQAGQAASAELPELPPEKGKESPALPGHEVLRRVHRQGVCFVQKVPADLLTGSFSATITIRLGNVTFTSEEFQARSANVGLDELAARVDQSLATLRTKADEQVGFMDLKPAATQLKRELYQLAPAGFEDASGEFELHRQWCLAVARKIDDACDRGEEARIADLSLQCSPRLKEMRSILARSRKEPEPPTEIPVK